MYNNPYFIPGFNPTIMNSSMIAPNLTRGVATNGLLNGTRGLAANTIANTAKNTGLLSRLGSGLTGIKSINWGGLINNTSKTLGIINQTIPLVRQVGPMVNNMKSMVKVASLFKDETDIPKSNQKNKSYNQNIPTNKTSTNKTSNNQINYTQTTKDEYNESPTFFINT